MALLLIGFSHVFVRVRKKMNNSLFWALPETKPMNTLAVGDSDTEPGGRGGP